MLACHHYHQLPLQHLGQVDQEGGEGGGEEVAGEGVGGGPGAGAGQEGVGVAHRAVPANEYVELLLSLLGVIDFNRNQKGRKTSNRSNFP